MWMRMRSGFLSALAAAILGALPLAQHAGAAVFDCDEFGVQTAVGTGGGPQTFSCSGPTTVTLTSATLDVFASVILDGEGLLTISGGDVFQVFNVLAGATLEVRNLVVTEGNGDFLGNGGCFLVAAGGSLVVTGSTIADCHAPLVVLGTGGGAIFNNGSVTIIDTTISGNTAQFGGGAIYSGSSSAAASVSVSGSEIVGNSAALGGGVLIQMGGLTLGDTSVSGIPPRSLAGSPLWAGRTWARSSSPAPPSRATSRPTSASRVEVSATGRPRSRSATARSRATAEAPSRTPAAC
jgi:predicted outer membrane repeat protein